MTAKLR